MTNVSEEDYGSPVCLSCCAKYVSLSGAETAPLAVESLDETESAPLAVESSSGKEAKNGSTDSTAETKSKKKKGPPPRGMKTRSMSNHRFL